MIEFLIVIWVSAALAVCALAKHRGRSAAGWVFMSVLISPVLSAAVLLLLRPLYGARNETAQLLFDSLPDDGKQRVLAAEAKREADAAARRNTPARRMIFGVHKPWDRPVEPPGSLSFRVFMAFWVAALIVGFAMLTVHV